VNATIYLVRHGEIEHHRTDVSLTARGREQAGAVGRALTSRIGQGEAVFIFHSPVTRVRETAELAREALRMGLRVEGVTLHSPELDVALSNVRFVVSPEQGPEEPSLVYARINAPAYLSALPPARAAFYRGFWDSPDPMGYWLTHPSDGGAETPECVLGRLLTRLREILTDGKLYEVRTHWIMVTHSGAMRALLRHAFGADPGEPNFCEIVVIEPSESLSGVTLVYRNRTIPLNLAEVSSAPK